ncbi:alpha/beta hydrolase [Nocardia sp. NPDC046473]|uniref:alpha/beta hydrolase n=1 Tax=Nocardia sp. NPDC046473 TaxID=3155733 RepID=UPI0033C08A2E
MNLRCPASAVAILCTAVALSSATATAAEPTGIPEAIDIPCAARTLHQNADWYLPAGTPRGLLWLQHGFARTDANVAALAEDFAAAGYLVFAPSLPFIDISGCTLQNLGDNTGFLNNVADLFGTATDPTAPLARSLARAADSARRTDLRIPDQLVFIGHSAGAEAIEYVAHRLHTDYPGTWPSLRGLVLLDPVKSFLGNNTERALADLDTTALPILTISAPPSLCNSLGSGTAAVQQLLHRSYVGIRIGSGVHTDAEGPSGDLMGDLLCGTPESVNISTLRTLAIGWAGDFVTGTRTADYYPVDAPRSDAAEAKAAVANAIAAAPTAQILSGS